MPKGTPLSLREWGVIIVGLTLGSLLGSAILRGGPQIDPWDVGPRPQQSRGSAGTRSEAGARSSAASTASGSPAETSRDESDRDLEVLRQRVAQLEKRQLEQRLAALEADLDASDPEADKGALPPGPSRSVRTGPASVASPKAARVGKEPARSSNNSDRGETAEQERSAPLTTARPSAKGPTGPATLAWWNGVNSVIAREATMRTAPANLTAADAGGFLESRVQAGTFAAREIGHLDATGVDPDALALGSSLVAWYQEELALAERAKSLMGSRDVAARKGSAGNAWKSGEEEHRQKCDEINRRGAELRTRLTSKYGLPFPPLN